jgi:hypothetical protein
MAALPGFQVHKILEDEAANTALASAIIPADHPFVSDSDYWSGAPTLTAIVLRGQLAGANIPHPAGLGKPALLILARGAAALYAFLPGVSQGSRLGMAAAFIPVVEASDSPVVLTRRLERQ